MSHLTPMEIEAASIIVYINTEGLDQIATDKEGEALGFDKSIILSLPIWDWQSQKPMFSARNQTKAEICKVDPKCSCLCAGRKSFLHNCVRCGNDVFCVRRIHFLSKRT